MKPFARFYRNICDAVWEIFLKVGYSPAAVSLNYPPKTLKTLLGDRSMSDDAMQRAFSAFATAMFDASDRISLKPNHGTFLVTVSAALAEKIHKEVTPNAFLAAWIGAASHSTLTRESVHEIFEKSGGRVEFSASKDPDFDERIRFLDGFDEYIYCFEYGDLHTEYHRLLPEDYEELYGPLSSE